MSNSLLNSVCSSEVVSAAWSPQPAPVAEYDAVKASPKRKRNSGRVRSEDSVLTGAKRTYASSGTQDLYRNLSIVANAVRMHLNYNTQFSLKSDSGDDVFDEEFEAVVEEWSQPENFEASCRFSRQKYTRLLECLAVIDGDCGSLRLQSGMIQAVESDLIRNPDSSSDEWVNGVKADRYNKPQAYSISDRGRGGQGYQPAREYPAEFFHLHAYLHRFDQLRGVSPLLSASNDFQDVYEGKTLSMAKMKAEQLIALVFHRDALDGPGQLDASSAVEDPDSEVEGDEEEVNRAGYQVDFGSGPVLIDADPGDDVKFIQGDNPGSNSREFILLVIMIALRSLDIPFSFFDESYTNFFGQKTAWMHYERACSDKRATVAQFLNWWLKFRIQVAVSRRQLVIPRSVLSKGYSLQRPWFKFIPVGMPWWKPSEEVSSSSEAIGNGFTSPQLVCRSIGTDFKRNVRDTAKAIEYAKSRGLRLEYGSGKSGNIDKLISDSISTQVAEALLDV
ncbi:Phage portal protein, lambda family [Thalassoglobus neptunius]|uniref:Phage portal protein, lambda family n=1 Tax=Thalassoglobus neptunius TaxID=1938619 RepID=A0A5C5WP67_9PLAN|nr:phage portal protein [Thalassoglobus neptunius]TWT51833.1 Phage portal protein, lambda family [Thalassoglobus neptunius]